MEHTSLNQKRKRSKSLIKIVNIKDKRNFTFVMCLAALSINGVLTWTFDKA